MAEPEDVGLRGFLRVRNWDRWQSYRRDRQQPPWIKLHRELMRNQDWIALTDAQKAHLVSIWMLAADRDGLVPEDANVIKKICCLDSEPDLNLFIELGFIDANVTPKRRQRAVTATPEKRSSDALDKEAETDTEVEAETEKKETRASALASEFKEIWTLYPHKVGKPAALKAYSAARRKASQEEIREGIERYVASKPPDRPWCNPATFFNQERWADQPAPVSQSPPQHRLSKTQQAAQELLEEIDRGTADPSRRRLCGPDSFDAAFEPSAPSPRPSHTLEAPHHTLHGRANGGFEEDG